MEESKTREILICSDSHSVLSSLRSFKSRSRQYLVYEVINTLTRILRQDSCVRFMWVLAHCALSGNEKADGVAKQALNK